MRVGVDVDGWHVLDACSWPWRRPCCYRSYCGAGGRGCGAVVGEAVRRRDELAGRLVRERARLAVLLDGLDGADPLDVSCSRSMFAQGVTYEAVARCQRRICRLLTVIGG